MNQNKSSLLQLDLLEKEIASKVNNLLNSLKNKCEREGLWVIYNSKSYPLPPQGWKIHISSTEKDCLRIAQTSTKYLIKNDISFKIAHKFDVLRDLNYGNYGIPQIGKFITIYPKGYYHTRKILKELYELTKGFTGPEILSDRQYKNSVLFYRYGSFVDNSYGRKTGRDGLIKNKKNQLELDHRLTYYFQPSWVKSLFSNKLTKSKLIGKKYLFVENIVISPSGSVFKAIDITKRKPKKVVIKQAKKHSVEDILGRDAQDRLSNETEFLKLLEGLNISPHYYFDFTEGNSKYLIMEQIEGKSLEHYIRYYLKEKSLVPKEFIMSVMIALCNIIKEIHSMEMVIRDLKPLNIVIEKGQNIKIVDWEIAYKLDRGGIPLVGSSDGYSSPQQKSSLTPSFADDIYSLGSIYYYLLTGTDPSKTDIISKEKIQKEENLSIQDKRIISKLHEPSASKRISHIELVKQLLINHG